MPTRGPPAVLIAWALIVILVGLPTVARAAVSSIDPSSGETTPGGSASATVTVDSGILTTCLTATSDTPLVVTFDGLTTICGTGIWSSLMIVEVPAVTSPGTYTVTVQEVDLLGSLLEGHPWPLTVIASSTTTTLLPDPTLTTTTTTTSTTTTTLASSTTTTQGPSSTAGVTTTPSPLTEPDGSASGGAANSSTGPAPGGSAGGEDDAAAAGQPSEMRDREPFSEIAVSSGLIDLVDRALPPVFAQAVASPLVILEVLLRALARTTAGLILPLALTVALAIGLARRLRHDAEGLPDLEDRVGIPVVDNREED